jgi:hypothetical protein
MPALQDYTAPSASKPLSNASCSWGQLPIGRACRGRDEAQDQGVSAFEQFDQHEFQRLTADR